MDSQDIKLVCSILSTACGSHEAISAKRDTCLQHQPQVRQHQSHYLLKESNSSRLQEEEDYSATLSEADQAADPKPAATCQQMAAPKPTPQPITAPRQKIQLSPKSMKTPRHRQPTPTIPQQPMPTTTPRRQTPPSSPQGSASSAPLPSPVQPRKHPSQM